MPRLENTAAPNRSTCAFFNRDRRRAAYLVAGRTDSSVLREISKRESTCSRKARLQRRKDVERCLGTFHRHCLASVSRNGLMQTTPGTPSLLDSLMKKDARTAVREHADQPWHPPLMRCMFQGWCTQYVVRSVFCEACSERSSTSLKPS